MKNRLCNHGFNADTLGAAVVAKTKVREAYLYHVADDIWHADLLERITEPCGTSKFRHLQGEYFGESAVYHAVVQWLNHSKIRIPHGQADHN